jgi:hypothetical protein
MVVGVVLRRLRDWVVQLAHPQEDRDRRRNARLVADLDVVITLPAGSAAAGTVDGRSLNLSRGGACVLVPRRIASGTSVFLRLPMIDRSTFASVRRCQARGDCYALGLEFRDGLRLDDPCKTGFLYRQIRGARFWNSSEN